jgi:hypothetical protein
MEDAIRAKDTELEGRAWLGLAAVAGHRGNYPSVIESGKRALALLDSESPFVADAHIALMVAAMSTNDMSAAFEHGWRGYDASREDIERRATMVSNLAFLALRNGRFVAARRGLIATLSMSQLDRIQLPALGGLALVSAATRNVAELERVARMIDRAADASALPYETARMRFELAQAWQEAGKLEKAEQCMARGRDLAVAHGFHEVSFRSDVLAEAIQASKVESGVVNDRVERAIARFSELAVDETLLVGA